MTRSSAPTGSPPVMAPRRAALAFIFITAVLDVLALGVIIPVLPRLVTSFYGGDPARAAWTYGWFGTVFALMQLLFSPLLGALSDRFGRRPVVLLSNLGLGVDYVLMALAPSLALLFVGRVVSGITAASFSTAGAYIADVTPPEKRAASFGMLGAAFGLGFVIGPALGGLLGSIGPRVPFWVAAALSLTNFCYGYFVLPESLAPESRRPLDLERVNPLSALRLFERRPQMLRLGSVIFLYYLAHAVWPAIFVLYVDYRFHWGTRPVGFTLAAMGVLHAVVQGGLMRPALARLGERRLLLVGVLAGVVGFVLFGLAPSAPYFWGAMPVMAFWGFILPSAQGLLSQQVDATEQGRLQGAIAALSGVANVLGPTLFSQCFALFAGPWRALGLPGAPFFVAAVLLGLGLSIAWRAIRSEPATARP